MINTSILSEDQLNLFKLLKKQEWLAGFYLAGGTALALQIHHRRSIDFDFFTLNDFENPDLLEKIKLVGDYEIFSEDINTLHCYLNKVLVSFITHKYKLIDQLFTEKNINIIGISDIACMKLSAIAGRGSKKDFIDFYYILKQLTLNEIIDNYRMKYGTELNQYQMLKSLVYFTDAEKQPMPVMLEKINWEEIKETLIKIVKEYEL